MEELSQQRWGGRRKGKIEELSQQRWGSRRKGEMEELSQQRWEVNSPHEACPSHCRCAQLIMMWLAGRASR